MSKVATLRMWHPVHWLFGQLLPWSSLRWAWPVSRLFYLVLPLAAAGTALAASFVWGFNGLLAGPVVLIAGVYLRIRPIASSIAWSVGGAGRPMLEIADGRVRGRLRPLWSDEVATADPMDPGWWDLDIAAADVVGVRIARSHAGPTLVLDLPPQISVGLCTHPSLAPWVGVWRDRVGSPAAWQVGMMRPPGLRLVALRGLLTALEAHGAPASQSALVKL